MFYESIITEILNGLSVKRLSAEQAAKNNYAILTSAPGFKKAEDACNSAMFALAKAKDPEEEKLKAEYDGLLAKRNALITGQGMDPADLLPAYACALCGDTGYARGALCACVKRAANARVKAEFGLSGASAEFDGTDFSKIPDEKQRAALEELGRRYFEAYEGIAL